MRGKEKGQDNTSETKKKEKRKRMKFLFELSKFLFFRILEGACACSHTLPSLETNYYGLLIHRSIFSLALISFEKKEREKTTASEVF